MPDSSPTASIQNLKLRADLMRRLRSFFHARDYWEVETPLLSADTVVDRYIEPIAVPSFSGAPDDVDQLWLQTSPEFAMKRLVAAGADKIYQICKAFRAGEVGSRHNPEFTIVEWYRVGQSYRDAMQFLSDLAADLLDVETADLVTYQQAFEDHLSINPHTSSIEDLRNSALENEVIAVGQTEPVDRDDWLNLLLATIVEPQLGQDRPTILYDYPASQAALAKIRPGAMPVAERFELYIRGIELANGYHELTDAEELRQRNAKVNAQRESDGTPRLPENSRLLDAMKHGLPACSGVALGFDRLAGLVIGDEDIGSSISFPISRA